MFPGLMGLDGREIRLLVPLSSPTISANICQVGCCQGPSASTGGEPQGLGWETAANFRTRRRRMIIARLWIFTGVKSFFRYDTNNRGSRRAAGPERRVHVNTKCHVHKRYLVQPVRLLARLAKRAQIDLSRRRYSYILRSWRRRHIGGSEEKGRLEA